MSCLFIYATLAKRYIGITCSYDFRSFVFRVNEAPPKLQCVVLGRDGNASGRTSLRYNGSDLAAAENVSETFIFTIAIKSQFLIFLKNSFWTF